MRIKETDHVHHATKGASIVRQILLVSAVVNE